MGAGGAAARRVPGDAVGIALQAVAQDLCRSLCQCFRRQAGALALDGAQGVRTAWPRGLRFALLQGCDSSLK
jgi:hypothetical protein